LAGNGLVPCDHCGNGWQHQPGTTEDGMERRS